MAAAGMIFPMTSLLLTIAVLDAIRAAGYSLGECKVIRLDGSVRYRIDATDAESGEKFTVTAPTVYEAAVEIARQIGFELEQ